jgi:hypothetical protein
MPVAFWIYYKRRVDPDRDDVLVLIPRFETGEQSSSVARVGWIASHTRQCAGKALVVGNVRDIKARIRVPRAIALGREP